MSWRRIRRRCCRCLRRCCTWAGATHVRLGRDYYVRVDTNDYSVDPCAIGARVDVAADLEVVRVRHGERLVAEHPRRWARGMTVTDPAHVAAAAALRHDYQHPTPSVSDEAMVRDLADYDRAFGLGEVSQP